MENFPLLVIDLQNAFMKSIPSDFIGKLDGFLKRWKPANLYWLRFVNHPGSFYEQHINYADCMVSPDRDIMGLPSFPADAPRQIVTHYGYAPPADFIASLKAAGHTKVGICGVDTDACVMAACFALWDAEIQPIIFSQYCHSSGGVDMHRAALSMMFRQFGMHSMR